MYEDDDNVVFAPYIPDVHTVVNMLAEPEEYPKQSNKSYDYVAKSPYDAYPSKKDDQKVWAHKDGVYMPCNAVTERLPAGEYHVNMTDTGPFFKKVSSNFDELIMLPESHFEYIIDNIKSFWDKKEQFEKYGFIWKRGILLHGPAGSGKTSLVQLISKFVIENDGIVVTYQSSLHAISSGLDSLRKIEPDRPVMIIIEDIDCPAGTEVKQNSDMLQFLDGEHQIKNVIVIATTNYPELLSQRLVNRPSRFDIVQLIDVPNADSRKMYLNVKYPDLEDDLAKWVKQTEGFSLAHLRELVVSVLCLGNSFDATINRLKKMISDELSSNKYGHQPARF